RSLYNIKPLSLARLNLYQEIIESADAPDLHFIFDHVLDAANHVVNRARVDVHSANGQHTVGAPQYSAPDPRECAPAGARRRSHLDEIAGSIAQHRHADAAGICYHQL